MDNKVSEEFITDCIEKYLYTKVKGNWHQEKTKRANKHNHDVDLKIIGGNGNSEYFYIECKKQGSGEEFLNALGQLVTRMKAKPNGAYKYGLGLYKQSSFRALNRISKTIADYLQLHIFAVDEEGSVVQFTPKDFGKSKKEYEKIFNERKNNNYK